MQGLNPAQIAQIQDHFKSAPAASPTAQFSPQQMQQMQDHFSQTQDPTLLDKVKSFGGAAVQGAAQGLSDGASAIGNLGAQLFRLPKSAPMNFLGPEAMQHPYVATAGSMVPMLAVPEARIGDATSVVDRLISRMITGGAMGAVMPNANPNASVGDVATGAALGAGGAAILPPALTAAMSPLRTVGGIVAKPLNAMLGGIQKSAERDIAQGIPGGNLTPQQADVNMQNIQQMGVTKPTLGAVTGSPGASSVTELSTVAPWSGQKQPLRQTLAQGDAAAQHIYNDLSGGKDIDDLEPTINAELQGVIGDNKGFSGAGYTALSNVTDKVLAGAPIAKYAAMSGAKQMLKNNKASIVQNRSDDRITDLTVNGLLNIYSKPYNIAGGAKLQNLINDRARVGSEIGNQDIPTSQTPFLNKMYANFTNDIESNLDHGVSPEMKQAWATDFSNQVGDVVENASHPENAAKLQAAAESIKDRIFNDPKATLKDIWKETNDWHRDNVAPLTGQKNINLHTYQDLNQGIGKTLLSEPNEKALGLLPSDTQKAVIASHFKKALTGTDEQTNAGQIGLSAMARSYDMAKKNNAISTKIQGLTTKLPNGAVVPLKGALDNILKLNKSVKDLRPIANTPWNGAKLKGLIGGTAAGAAGLATLGPIGALGSVAALSGAGRLVGSLMRSPYLIKAYANPAYRQDIIYKMLKIGAPNKAAQFMRGQNLSAPAGMLANQIQQQM